MLGARRMLVTLLIGLVACSRGGAEQPVVRDGVRSIYEMDLDALPANGRAAGLEQAVRVTRKRLASAHVVARVAVEGERLVVDIASTDRDTLERAQALISRTGKLEIHAVDAAAEYTRQIAEAARTQAPAGITSEQETWHTDSRTTTATYLRAADTEETVDATEAQRMGCFRGPVVESQVRCDVSGRRVIERYLASLAVKPPDDRRVAYERIASDDGRPAWRTYLIDRRVAVSGTSIQHASAAASGESVTVELDRAGSEALAALTGAHVGDKLAYLLDDRVVMAPIIASAIPGGKLTLRLGGQDPARRKTEAEELAIVLDAGALPAPLILAERANLVGGVVKH